MNDRPVLGDIGLGAGKTARLTRILFQHGLGNGTALFLPYDQGLEHGPRDFFANPAASGLIFGRNVWQRPHEESLRFVGALRKILDQYPSTPR